MRIPTGSEIYEKHLNFMAETYRIVEAAIALAVEDFERRGRPIEEAHLASYVRNEAKGQLLALQGTSLECMVVDLPNNGIQIVRDGEAFRLRKRTEDGIPSPTQSAAMKLYWEQMPLDLIWSDEPSVPNAAMNLYLLWEIDYQTRSLASLELALPGQWMIAIPHPASSVRSAPAPTVAPTEDLEFELPAEAFPAGQDKGSTGKSS